MSRFQTHSELFIEASRYLIRFDGINRAIARNTGLLIRLKRDPSAQASLRAAAEESARTAPPLHFNTTAEQHAANQARMHAASQWWACEFLSSAPADLTPDDEWLSPRDVREIVSQFVG